MVLAALVCFSTSEAADRSIGPIVSRIKRQPIESQALAAVGYSSRLRALEIEFRDERIYRYLDVPWPVYRELVSAESKARFYNKNVRGRYRCLRVKAPPKR